MKTAVSIPDKVYQQADRYAKKAKLSRSQLYAKALHEYLQTHGGQTITKKLDEVYLNESSAIDPAITKAQAEVWSREEW
jgi:metal-responsive CopG/Arc/MetJ family transcriptional regulator